VARSANPYVRHPVGSHCQGSTATSRPTAGCYPAAAGRRPFLASGCRS
jgi:hypothetical protein